MTDGTISHAAAPRPAGRRILWWLFAAVIALAAVIGMASMAIWGTGSEGILHVTRYTARFAFLIFIVVFAAGALAQLIPSNTTGWLKRNRRYLGLSFALAHFIHLGALSSYFAAVGEIPDIVTIIGGRRGWSGAAD